MKLEEEWALRNIQRLLSAGCPVSHELLLRRYPLRVVMAPVPDINANLFPLLGDGTGLMFWTKITAVAPVTIRAFALRDRHGAVIPVRWTEWCDKHEGYCLHDYVGGPLRATQSLNQFADWLKANGKNTIALGDEFEGYLVGISPKSVPVDPNTPTEAFLTITDRFANEYFFPIALFANPPAPEPQKMRTAHKELDKRADEFMAILEEDLWRAACKHRVPEGYNWDDQPV